ncbi:hypothetical protein V6N13_072776 [Hibiscus sabdariffa]
MIFDKVTPAENWDWDRVQDLLDAVLEHMTTTPPPLAHLGDDVPGWRMILDDDYVERESVLVRVCQVCRERNGVADKLASLGRKHTLQGRGFVVPPGPVVVIVAEEHECWDELRAAGASQVYAAAG